MRLSTRGQYAVRALIDLAYHSHLRPVRLESIAQREEISITYLEQLFLKMRRRKLVKSVRGPGGGYLLSRPAKEITVAEIIEAVEEPLTPVACLENFRCDLSNRCVAQEVWRELGSRIKGFLSSLTLEDLVTRYHLIQMTREEVLRRKGDAQDLHGS